MARSFNAAQALGLASALGSPPFTMACWFLANNVTDDHTLISICESAGGAGGDLYLLDADGSSGGDPLRAGVYASGGGGFAAATTSSGFSASAWSHAAGVFAATDDRRVYLNGGNKGTNSTSISPDGFTHTYIASLGRTDGDNQECNGYIAEAAIWSAALTDTEVAILAKGYSPLLVRPESLVAYWPLIGRFSPEIDLVGANGLTLYNAPPAVAHPRIFQWAARIIVSVAVASASSTVALAWSDNTGSEAGYSIERSTTSAVAGFVEIDTVAADAESYNNTGLAANTYWYRVRAYDADGNYSDYSNVAEVTVT